MRKRTPFGQLRYAIYLRCSTDDQKEGDYTTIDTQREINTSQVARNGGLLAGEYADEGRSGTNLNRPGWERLLCDAKAGKIDVVCVTYMSRLGRGNAFVIAEYELQKYGVRVEMVQEKYSDDMAGYLQKQMTVMIDGIYPQMVRQWTITKMEQMFRRGYYVGGGKPFGYRTEAVKDADSTYHGDKEPPKRLVLDPIDAPIVRQAFETFEATRSGTAVLELLQACTTRLWSYTKVKYLLTNLRLYRCCQVARDDE
jgi:DNA invertase Pin-like site-specific DNA recombinase